jgi:hypothetical protein
MGWARDLTSHENELCQALGETLVFWNHVEQSFRVLLQRATHIGGPDGRLWSLIAHLTPVQLKEAMISIAADHDGVRADHLIHCAKAFDREREYRNHYVHGPITFLTTDTSSEALASSVTARGGSLSIKQARISLAELNAFKDRLGALSDYIKELLEDSRTLRSGKSLADLAKPAIAASLPSQKFSWWEIHDPKA